MPGCTLLASRKQVALKRDTMAQIKAEQRKQGAEKFQVRPAQPKRKIPRFAA